MIMLSLGIEFNNDSTLYLSVHCRDSKQARCEHFEKLFGTKDVPPCAERGGLLEVVLPTAVPGAFEMVLNYIYTDRIECESIMMNFVSHYIEGRRLFSRVF